MSSIELQRASVASSVSWTPIFQPCASQTKSVGHEVLGAELTTQKIWKQFSLYIMSIFWFVQEYTSICRKLKKFYYI